MAESNAKKELRDLRNTMGLNDLEFLNYEENREILNNYSQTGKLPENTFSRTDDAYEFYTIKPSDLTEREQLEYILLKQHAELKTMRKCIVFFTVLTVIGLIASLIIALL